MTDPVTKLSAKQQKATDCYIANCLIAPIVGYSWSQAMRDAGYAESTINDKSGTVSGLFGVQEQIQAKRLEIAKQSIATRSERQSFWTKVQNGEIESASMADRLRASELLGRSEADFTDNITNSVPDQSKVLTKAEQEQALRDKIKLLHETGEAGTAVAG